MAHGVKPSIFAPLYKCTVDFEEKSPWSTVAYRGECSEFIDYLTKVKNAEEKGMPSEKGPYSGTICQALFREKCHRFENMSVKDVVSLFNRAMGKKA